MLKALTNLNFEGLYDYLSTRTLFVPYKTNTIGYYFAMQSEGTLAKAIPAGYEIYENPNAQVFLRRIPPKIITDEERQVVEEGMRTYATVKDYKIDVKGNALLIYTADTGD